MLSLSFLNSLKAQPSKHFNISVKILNIDMLFLFFSYRLQLYSAWALSKIGSRSSEQINAGAVAGLISLLRSPHAVVAQMAIWALGKIAADGPNLRDHVIQAGIIEPLLLLIEPETSVSLSCCFSNLCILTFCSRPLSGGK
jgi:Armadillo/beta-catenin-like repeat